MFKRCFSKNYLKFREEITFRETLKFKLANFQGFNNL